MERLDAIATNAVLLLGIGMVAGAVSAVFRTIQLRGARNTNAGVLVVGVALSGLAGFYLQHWVRDYLLTSQARQPVSSIRMARLIYGACDVASIAALLTTSALGGYLAALLSVTRGRAGQVTRGALVESAKHWQATTRKARRKHWPFVTIAGCGLQRGDEVKHFAIMGTTGTGKSVAIREMLVGAAARGDRAIIADPDGGFLARFYDPARGDVILNPFDARSAAWDMMAEAPNDFAADQLAASLIPDPGGSADSTWAARARVLLSAILRRGRLAGIDIAEVYRLFAVAPREELQILLGGTSAEPFLAEGATRLFDNVRSSTGDALNALEYVAHAGKQPFSVSRWAASDSKAWVFLPYRADQIAALKSLIGPWMRLAIFATMSRPEGDRNPTWFVADELDAIGKIQGLDDALQRVRKFGGRCVLGFQTIGKVRAIYGDGIAAALVENCGTRLVLRCAGGERNSTAAFASSLIGQQSYYKQSTNQGQHSSGTSSGSSITTVTEDAVLASQIEQLPDLEGYLKAPSFAPWHTVKVPFVDMPQRSPSFVGLP
jgi:hypothetical protein